MFRAFYRLSSGAQWLQWQPLVLPSYRGDIRALFVVGPAGRSAGPTTNTARISPQYEGKTEAATAVTELLMMGGKTPETCWAVNKRQDNKLEKLLRQVGDLFELNLKFRCQKVKERSGYSHLKEEALDRSMWRARFGRGFGPVVRQTDYWMKCYRLRKYVKRKRVDVVNMPLFLFKCYLVYSNSVIFNSLDMSDFRFM